MTAAAPAFRRDRSLRVALPTAAIASMALAAGAWLDPAHFYVSYLVAYTFLASIAVGALLFLMICNAMGATWPVALRRVTEAIISVMPLLIVLVVPLFFGLRTLYPWLRVESLSDEHAIRLIEHRRRYLNLPFFLVRAGVYLVVWNATAFLLRRWSIQQDRDPRIDVAGKSQLLSVVALPAVALAISFAAFDWLMSLNAAWFTTMFPVYVFAGGFLGALATLTLLSHLAERTGHLRELRSSHFYALGRLLLAFTIFWAYAAFFQFLIIWMADLPEEAGFYATRMRPPWSALSLALIVGQFALPFLVLLNYHIKQKGRWLAAVSAWLLLFHWVDVHWLVAPTVRPTLVVHWLDPIAVVALTAWAVVFAAFRSHGVSTLPLHDPRLEDALRYESS